MKRTATVGPDFRRDDGDKRSPPYHPFVLSEVEGGSGMQVLRPR